LAWRVAVNADFEASWRDRWQGAQRWQLGREVKDFVVRRKDQLFAYQLAVVVDDQAQRITQVVRGSDLLDSTPRQIWLQQLLGYAAPVYGHLPVLTNRAGQKLSKQTHAPALDNRRACNNLRLALGHLRQPPPATGEDDCRNLLAFATTHWQPAAVPALTRLAPGAD
ncbi:MAG: glutamate--tRNA ligase family protein, partial [Parahaliea sp.]